MQPRLQAAGQGALGGPVGQAITAIVTLGKGTVTNQVPEIHSILTLVFLINLFQSYQFKENGQLLRGSLSK
jgi:hypothetical protein